MSTKLMLILLTLSGMIGCRSHRVSEIIDLSGTWHFSPDTGQAGMREKWYTADFDNSGWDTLHAGERWEDQGYPNLDGNAWYRKRVDIPAAWKGKEVWIKFGGVNDAYVLFVNGQQASMFGNSHYSFAGRPSFTKVTDKILFGRPNLVAVKVNDWGNSGGL